MILVKANSQWKEAWEVAVSSKWDTQLGIKKVMASDSGPDNSKSGQSVQCESRKRKGRSAEHEFGEDNKRANASDGELLLTKKSKHGEDERSTTGYYR